MKKIIIVFIIIFLLYLPNQVAIASEALIAKVVCYEGLPSLHLHNFDWLNDQVFVVETNHSGTIEQNEYLVERLTIQRIDYYNVKPNWYAKFDKKVFTNPCENPADATKDVVVEQVFLPMINR